MNGDTEEPDTELQLQLDPSTSSQDHEISEEPPIDNVREGSLPGNQKVTMEQESNTLSMSPLLSISRSTVFKSETEEVYIELNHNLFL
ncbi:hypothetical protein NL676_034251 [Syzygium grande]|nr:hypothetical protein NL676_034251 [Syzygium grande]